MANSAISGSPTLHTFSNLRSAGVRHGVTGRDPSLPAEGDFSYVTGPSQAVIERNRRDWLGRLGLELEHLACGRQVHGVACHAVTTRDAGAGAFSVESALPRIDGLMTAAPSVPLAVLSADCVPILIYDQRRHIAAAIHAGWRGTVEGIAGAAVHQLSTRYGSDPSDLLVGLGPSIGPCCYDVGPEVIDAWHRRAIDDGERAVVRSSDRLVFDLWTANRLQLVAAGVPAVQIEASELCTRCHADRYFSRRAGRGHRGLFASIIALD